MSDGARTRDILDHNQVLYQLSYTHHAPRDPEACAARYILAVLGGCFGHTGADGSTEASVAGCSTAAEASVAPAPATCWASFLAVVESGPGLGTKTAAR